MKRVCYLSPFIPREWIAAHGLSPCCLTLSAELAHEGMGAGMCPYAQALMARAEKWDNALLVLTTTCDQMRRIAELITQRWNSDNKQDALFVFNVPSTWGPGARELYRDELQRLGRFLVNHGGKVPNSELVRDLLEHAAGATARSASITNPGEENDATGRISVALMGGPLLTEHQLLHDLIRRAGGRVVVNGTEGEERTSPHFPPLAPGLGLLETLTMAYFDVIPDAFRRPDVALREWLTRHVRERDIKGIIFHAYTWCDHWRAAQRHLANLAGVPALYLELGSAPQLEGHTQTRIEAFLESLA